MDPCVPPSKKRGEQKGSRNKPKVGASILVNHGRKRRAELKMWPLGSKRLHLVERTFHIQCASQRFYRFYSMSYSFIYPITFFCDIWFWSRYVHFDEFVGKPISMPKRNSQMVELDGALSGGHYIHELKAFIPICLYIKNYFSKNGIVLG